MYDLDNRSYIISYTAIYSNPMSDRAQKSYWFLGNKVQGTENR
jgi:hypothetical protein